MARRIRWLLPVAIVALPALARRGGLGPRAAAGVGAVAEAVLLLLAGWRALLIARAYRRGRADGRETWAAFEDSLATILPRRVARLVALEPRLWWCLWRWLARRGAAGADGFAYRKRSAVGAIVVMAALSAPAELLAYELLIPWAWLRTLLLLASLYGAFWLLGYAASLVVLPHRLEAGGLRLHHGVLAGAFLPYDAIAGVTCERRKAPTAQGLRVTPAGRAEDGRRYLATAHLAVGGRTDLAIRLRVPRALDGPFGPTPPVCAVRLAVDDPERLAGELARRIGPVAAGPAPADLAARGEGSVSPV